MIFILQMPPGAAPLAWFAFDAADLLRKVAALDLQGLRDTQARLALEDPQALAEAALRARGPCRVFADESAALAAFERQHDPAWQGEGWRARWALRDQLVATEVLAED